MGIFSASETANSIWGRLIIVAYFTSYGMAALVHENLTPVLYGFMLLLVVGIVYYLPLRFIYWIFTGDGEITNRFLLYLPIPFLTLMGVMMIFDESGSLR